LFYICTTFPRLERWPLKQCQKRTMESEIASKVNRVVIYQPDYQENDLVLIDNNKILDQPHPVKPDLNILCICTSGKLTGQVNGEPLNLSENMLFFCPPNYTLANVMLSPDFTYKCLCISNQTLQSFLHGNIDIWNQAIYMKKKLVHSVTAPFIDIFDKTFELIKIGLTQTDKEKDAHFRKNLINRLVSMMINGFCDHIRDCAVKGTTASPKRSSLLFSKFLDILQHSDTKHHTVAYYASQLYITPKYLTTICRTYSGKSAYTWICEFTMTDITYYLQNTQLTIKEVSNKLGFNNLSFFGKFVKEHIGCSPLEYRKQLLK
jgi:AraC family transcriptional activator of pobA